MMASAASLGLASDLRFRSLLDAAVLARPPRLPPTGARPPAPGLRARIARCRGRGACPAGHEAEEAAALWASVRAKAPRRTVPFDPTWFASLRSAAGGAAPAAPPRHDWGDAPAVPVVQGR